MTALRESRSKEKKRRRIPRSIRCLSHLRLACPTTWGVHLRLRSARSPRKNLPTWEHGTRFGQCGSHRPMRLQHKADLLPDRLRFMKKRLTPALRKQRPHVLCGRPWRMRHMVKTCEKHLKLHLFRLLPPQPDPAGICRRSAALQQFKCGSTVRPRRNPARPGTAADTQRESSLSSSAPAPQERRTESARHPSIA